MTDSPDDYGSFAKGFAACAALIAALLVFLRKGLGSLRNGNGHKPEEPNRSLTDYRINQLEERITKLEWLDEFERREKRRLDN